jgi:hypothetical protein
MDDVNEVVVFEMLEDETFFYNLGVVSRNT